MVHTIETVIWTLVAFNSWRKNVYHQGGRSSLWHAVRSARSVCWRGTWDTSTFRILYMYYNTIVTVLTLNLNM